MEPVRTSMRLGGMTTPSGRSNMSRSGRTASLIHFAAPSLAVALLVAACVGSGAVGTAHDGPSATPVSPAPATPGGPPTAGFYLRAWQTQALAPQETFGWLPVATVADGTYVDGRVAIPMIYPGPIWIDPSARPISAAGIAAIAAEAKADGLLGDKTDFSAGSAPGSILAHIQLTVDGVTHSLTGPLPSDASTTGAPGTVNAFMAFWNRIGTIDAWLAADLGQGGPYSPASIAVLVAPPTDAGAGITAAETPWPLASSFATFGQPFGGSVYRCATVTGPDLAKLLPVVQSSNALARFVDSAGVKMSLQVRVLVPGEPGPCA
jgi:hypothetical protein